MRSDDAATDCDRRGAFDDRNCVAAARAIGHYSIVLPGQGYDSAAPVARMRQANDYVAWRYLAMQLSKPSVISLPGRLRPMKTIRLSRFSPGFHGR